MAIIHFISPDNQHSFKASTTTLLIKFGTFYPLTEQKVTTTLSFTYTCDNSMTTLVWLDMICVRSAVHFSAVCMTRQPQTSKCQI